MTREIVIFHLHQSENGDQAGSELKKENHASGHSWSSGAFKACCLNKMDVKSVAKQSSA